MDQGTEVLQMIRWWWRRVRKVYRQWSIDWVQHQEKTEWG